AESKKITNDLKIACRIIQDREVNVNNALQSLKKDSMRLAEQAIQYGVLKREAESNRQMYAVLLERLKQTDIGGSIVVNNIRVIDNARIPKKPFKPNIPRNLLLSGVLGLFIGTGLCFLIEFFDNSFRNENDVASRLNLPLIGTIPYSKSKNRIISNGNNKLEHLVSKEYQESKAMLDFHRQEGSLDTLLVTSALQSEGKTVSVAALGMAFAHAGTKVLLVDADITTTQSLSKIFSVDKASGLSDFFIKNNDPAGLIQKTTLDNLYLLPRGLTPADPAELLGSRKMKQLIHNMKGKFDLVIIDSPPVSVTLGVSLLGNFIDGTVFIIRSNSTSTSMARDAVDSLRKLKVNIIGALLT
ncbi:MAG: polysaccharide biosynthesis tyrosine autokinase, partial [Candidatus Electrothrix sp. AR4]|nr:polysaccharide biosynthesis tyrosine autokinase [Candidatus Electrothrix sp. AR4]